MISVLKKAPVWPPEFEPAKMPFFRRAYGRRWEGLVGVVTGRRAWVAGPLGNGLEEFEDWARKRGAKEVYGPIYPVSGDETGRLVGPPWSDRDLNRLKDLGYVEALRLERFQVDRSYVPMPFIRAQAEKLHQNTSTRMNWSNLWERLFTKIEGPSERWRDWSRASEVLNAIDIVSSLRGAAFSRRDLSLETNMDRVGCAYLFRASKAVGRVGPIFFDPILKELSVLSPILLELFDQAVRLGYERLHFESEEGSEVSRVLREEWELQPVGFVQVFRKEL